MRSAEGRDPGLKQDGKKKPAEEPSSGKVLGNTDKEEVGRDGILVEFSQGFHQKFF